MVELHAKERCCKRGAVHSALHRAARASVARLLGGVGPSASRPPYDSVHSFTALLYRIFVKTVNSGHVSPRLRLALGLRSSMRPEAELSCVMMMNHHIMFNSVVMPDDVHVDLAADVLQP